MNVGQFKEVVVGASLPALMYAFMKHKPFIFTELPTLLNFKFFDVEDNLSPFNVFNQYQKKFLTKNGEKIVSISHEDLWDMLYFILSLKGLNLSLSKVNKILINENKLLALCNRLKYSFTFEKLSIFDTEKVNGLEIVENEPIKYEVLDNFIINYYKTDVEYFSSPYEKIKEMWVHRKVVSVENIFTFSVLDETEMEKNYDEVSLRLILKEWIENNFEKIGHFYAGTNEVLRKKNPIEHSKRLLQRIQPSFSCNREDVECFTLTEKEVLKHHLGFNEHLLEPLRMMLYVNNFKTVYFRHCANRPPTI